MIIHDTNDVNCFSGGTAPPGYGRRSGGTEEACGQAASRPMRMKTVRRI
jgi:hypothetical protein